MSVIDGYKNKVLVDFEGKTDFYTPVVFKKRITADDLAKTFNKAKGKFEHFIIAPLPKDFLVTKVVVLVYRRFLSGFGNCRLIIKKSNSSGMWFYVDLRYTGAIVQDNPRTYWFSDTENMLVGLINGAVNTSDGYLDILVEGVLTENKMGSLTFKDTIFETRLESGQWEKRQIVNDLGVLTLEELLALAPSPSAGNPEEGSENTSDNSSENGSNENGNLNPVPIENVELSGGK